MRRVIALSVVPLALLGFAVSYLRMVAAERRAKKAGGFPTAPHLWRWTFAIGVAAMVVGAVVAALSGIAHQSSDLLHSAITGTFMLVPGLVVGLAVGVGRWLASRSVWRGRAKGLH